MTSPALDRIDKKTLVNKSGVTLRAFRERLRPKYGFLWAQILAAYITLGVTIAVAAIGQPFAAQRSEGITSLAPFTVAWFLWVIAGAIVIGYAMAFLQLFFHEAAHFLIAKNRKMNDLLANIFIGSLVGQEIRRYRDIHFDHHRFLGTTRDTERSYFDPLTARFVVESLTGIRVLKVLSMQRKVARQRVVEQGTPKNGMVVTQLLLGVSLHGALLGIALWQHLWMLAAAWLIGMGVVFPFLASVRQVLEHRRDTAQSDIDYSSVNHGAHNRIFGDGLLASTLGGAGFNRHLLHHWEPQISCTNLKELDAFLMETEARDALDRRRTTYLKTLLLLFDATWPPRKLNHRRT